MIIVDSISQGSRGVVPNEDVGRYDFSTRVAFQSQDYVVEPRDPGAGQPISYRLEPFFPFLSLAERDLPIPPLVPLDLPGGELSITVDTPSGNTENLGSSQILQARTGMQATSKGFVLNNGGGNPGGVLQLTTLSDFFSYKFQEYGRYTIFVSGSVSDVWGQAYPFSSSFVVWAARLWTSRQRRCPRLLFRPETSCPPWSTSIRRACRRRDVTGALSHRRFCQAGALGDRAPRTDLATSMEPDRRSI